jgi:hypothetical protein
MLKLMRVTLVLRITIFKPVDFSCHVWRNVFDVRNNNRLFSVCWHEDLDSFVVIADGALVERTLDDRDFGSKRRGSTEVGFRPCPCRSRAGRRNLSRHEIARGECRCGHVMERPSLYVSEDVL